MPVLNTNQLVRWSCPVNLGASPPQQDTDGSRLLIHVQDNAGNDFEIRCVREALGFHYEYSISFPNGDVTAISECIYSLGFNDCSLVYQGPLSEVTAPNGTPVVNVGSILVVEHSNIEGQGTAATMTPKPGGKDFHMVYDYRTKFRYRLNTVVGQGVTSTDYFASRALATPHYILHADGAAMATLKDYGIALRSDYAFRKLDDPRAKRTPGRYQFQTADSDSLPIGYVPLDDGVRRGALLLDPSLHGASFELLSNGVLGSIPEQVGRSRSTLAVERKLLSRSDNGLTVVLDGKPLQEIELRPTKSMIVVDLPLNSRRHSLLLMGSVGSGRGK